MVGLRRHACRRSLSVGGRVPLMLDMRLLISPSDISISPVSVQCLERARRSISLAGSDLSERGREKATRETLSERAKSSPSVCVRTPTDDDPSLCFWAVSWMRTTWRAWIYQKTPGSWRPRHPCSAKSTGLHRPREWQRKCAGTVSRRGPAHKRYALRPSTVGCQRGQHPAAEGFGTRHNLGVRMGASPFQASR